MYFWVLTIAHSPWLVLMWLMDKIGEAGGCSAGEVFQCSRIPAGDSNMYGLAGWTLILRSGWQILKRGALNYFFVSQIQIPSLCLSGVNWNLSKVVLTSWAAHFVKGHSSTKSFPGHKGALTKPISHSHTYSISLHPSEPPWTLGWFPSHHGRWFSASFAPVK